jgi:hypothetical protein
VLQWLIGRPLVRQPTRKQKTDIGKYSFVNMTIQLWNQLLADVLGNLSCKPSNFTIKVLGT